MFAVAGGHAECAQLLIAAGCNIALLNDIGLTARALAEQLKRSDVLALDFSAITSVSANQPTAAVAGASVTQRQPPAPAHSTTGAQTSGLEESRKLKAELKALGLSTKGSKAELRARLAEAGV